MFLEHPRPPGICALIPEKLKLSLGVGVNGLTRPCDHAQGEPRSQRSTAWRWGLSTLNEEMLNDPEYDRNDIRPRLTA
jgi:hypothetical protein